MNIGNALGFCVVGLGMILLPSVVLDWFPPEELGGTNISALWIEFMGWVNGALGSGLLMRYAVVPQILRLLVWRPMSPRELLETELLRPAMEIYGEIESADHLHERRVA